MDGDLERVGCLLPWEEDEEKDLDFPWIETFSG